ncbi:MAG: hypothetical protein J5724_06390 [Ruminococcus sp.]|nr:hypothetical protein [Ruminococcus sp.]
MKNILTIKCTIDDISGYKERFMKFSNLSAAERYGIIKDNILSSDAVVFFNMTGGFMVGGKESPCMETLKKSADMYDGAVIGFPVQSRLENIGQCFKLDISSPEKKKLFLDNYRFYDHTDFIIELPELGTALRVADDRDYEPYSFFFLSDTELKMHIEHHTREVCIF